MLSDIKGLYKHIGVISGYTGSYRDIWGVSRNLVVYYAKPKPPLPPAHPPNLPIVFTSSHIGTMYFTKFKGYMGTYWGSTGTS